MTTENKTRIFCAKKLDNIPPYLFAEIDKKRLEAIERGVDIINLGIGDPDQPTPKFIVDAMHEAINDPSTHSYPPYQGIHELRKASVNWFSKRFNLPEFDINKECVVTIGMKEALHNLFLAVLDVGDYALIPSPGYPVYKTSPILACANYYAMPLKEENKFLVDFSAISEEIAKKAKILILSYPNNPTGAFATLEFFKEAVEFAKKYNILICHDNAYSEVYFDKNKKPISIFNVEGAKDVAIEMFSLSKAYNMTGWRVGFTVGNAEGIRALSTVKTNVDSGVFKAVQRAAVVALESDQLQAGSHLEFMNNLYRERAQAVEEGLKSLGWEIKNPSQGTLYVWHKIPRKFKTSIEFASVMLEKCGIVVPPGVGYGQEGEGFFRVALSAPVSRIQEAIKRMKDAELFY